MKKYKLKFRPIKPPKSNTVFARRLVEVLNDQQISIERLAREAGMDRQAIDNYLRIGLKPRVDKLVTICNTLYVSADYLLGLSNEP